MIYILSLGAIVGTACRPAPSSRLLWKISSKRTFGTHFTSSPRLIPRFNLRSDCSSITMATSSSQPTREELELYLEVALGAARDAGAVIAAAWDNTKTIEHKGAVDLVTETDKQCEALIFKALQESFPGHCFIGEEGSAAQGFTDELTTAPTWMVDPVDGTTNFVHRFPFSCVSIALAIHRQIVVGVVFNPILGEMFHAVRGGGSFLNDKPIHTSDTNILQNALVCTEIGTRRDDAFLDAAFGRFRALVKETRAVRACGSCALNLSSVAMGRLDAYYEVGLGGPWDIAAGAIILEEAGGQVLDPAGGPFNVMSRRVLGTNAHLAEAVSKILAQGPYAPEEPPPLPLA